LTFSDEIRSLAAALALRLDLKSIVLVRFPVIAETFVAFYGCAEAGMVPLIIGDDFSPSDLTYLTEKTGANALMLDNKTKSFENYVSESDSLGLKVFYCGETKIESGDAVSLREAVTVGNPSYRGPVNSGVNPLYTVKYTGVDEYATITHANVVISTGNYIDYFGLSPDDVFLSIRSPKIPFHEFSALPIMTGTPIIIMKDRLPATIYETIGRYGVTTLQIDDEYAAKLAGLKRKRPESLQHIIWSRSIYDGIPDETYGHIWNVPVTRLSGCFAISG
ncbi:MAG: long-chain fatty acid--CoA ligase, partial [bacterium]|nr:long-chain fatty acid--CoA ligase [bacterium]